MPFPCQNLPENPAEARLLGIYPQRPTGLFMQRVKILEARVRAEQWRGLAGLALRYGVGFPLHVTTRQDIELHGIRADDLPAVQRGIDELGLTGAAACGDSVRNIVVCPRHGFCLGTWDVGALVRAIRAAVESLGWREQLPRKFKISVSGCQQSCGRPWLNDLGLTANPDGSFRVILAGSLGVKPDLGVVAYESLPAGDAVALVVAVLRLFHAEGDRSNRSRARLRHVRQRLGTEVFLRRVEELFQEEKRERHWPVPALFRVESAPPWEGRLSLPLGDIAPETAVELADAMEAAGAEVQLGISHDLLIFAAAEPAWSPRLAALRTAGCVVACPGATWCMRGLADSRAAASRIRAALPGDCRWEVGITGCPNNCSQAATADIGLIGRVTRTAEGRSDSFRFVAGGGKGQTAALAVELHAAVPAAEVREAVAWLVGEHQRAHELHPISLADFVVASGDRLRGELAQRYGGQGIVSETPPSF